MKAISRALLCANKTKGGDSLPSNFTRLNVNLRAEDYDAVRELSASVGQDVSEFVRNSLRLYAQVIDESRQGSRLYFHNRRGKREVLIFPSIALPSCNSNVVGDEEVVGDANGQDQPPSNSKTTVDAI